MKYYHYTSLKSFSSILQEDSTKDKEICFWATRYDCFADSAEYVYGIDKLRSVLKSFEEKSNLANDRCISPLFDSVEIVKSTGLPVPYVISISARKDNDYMWKNYAENYQGVVLELDFTSSRGFYETALFSIESCIYDSCITTNELYKIVKDKYFEMAGIMLGGNKEFAITLLRDNPEAFVKFIAMCLLAFVAPRFKKDDFVKEEETRIIIVSPKLEYNALLDGIKYPIQIKPIVDKVQSFVAEEKRRTDNGRFYREIFMPISFLKRVYVRKIELKEKVEKILRNKGYAHIPVDIIN